MAAAFLIGCGRFTNWWIRLSRTDRMTPEGTIVALWISWLASWGIAAFWSNRTEKKGGIAAYVGSRILFYVSATLLLAPLSDRHYYAQMQFWHPNATERWILVALTAAGFLFVWWARIHLGRLWSDRLTKKVGHHVVDTGPYRIVRHPIYSGLIFAAFATAVEKGTSYGLFGAAILTIAFYTKALQEERFLRVEIGEEAYDAYARKTAMLLPFTGRPPIQK
jgi:protein-S-isoprenylcysteine O-methyltransferase Ste14